MTESIQASTLYVVATPIGNLGDFSQRAIDVLRGVDRIAAEDTRHSARLCQHFDIDTQLMAYHDHSDEAKVGAFLQCLERGESLALISDAGTPLISDPGYRLVNMARSRGIKVIPIPGACAFVAALSAAGLPSDRFTFEGFLVSKSGARQRQLEALANETRTLIFYESPHRIVDSLSDMVAAFGAERELVLARELSKTFETFIPGTAASVLKVVQADHNQQKGEMVVMVAGAAQRAEVIDPAVENIMRCLLAELPIKQAAKLTADITGLRKKVLYQWGLDNKS